MRTANESLLRLVCQTTGAVVVLALNVYGTPFQSNAVELSAKTEIAEPLRGQIARRNRLFKSVEAPLADESRRYRLFVPRQSNSRQTFPLLVWLHGFGESGTDNWRQLMHIRDEVERWEQRKNGFPGYVLVWQCPLNTDWGEAEQKALRQIIDHVVSTEPIDPHRVYCAGVSSGGTGCWKLAARYPQLFAAMCPMASSATSGEDNLAELPIWAFHSTGDRGISPASVRNAVYKLRARNGNCWLTEIPTENHDCWSSAFEEYGAIDWLLKQEQGRAVAAPPAKPFLKSLELLRLEAPSIAIYGGIAMIFGLIYLRTARKRKVQSKQIGSTVAD